MKHVDDQRISRPLTTRSRVRARLRAPASCRGDSMVLLQYLHVATLRLGAYSTACTNNRLPAIHTLVLEKRRAQFAVAVRIGTALHLEWMDRPIAIVAGLFFGFDDATPKSSFPATTNYQ